MTVRYPRPDGLPPATDRFVVVEASAGTGKTYFLEHRVADLIVAGARLDELLVVTFTDKAVAELRLRVRDLLDRMARATESTAEPSAWELDDDTRGRLRAAVNSFDRAPIFTIHGFCHRVLVEDAFAARRPLRQEQVADEVVFEHAFRALLAERFAKDDPDRGLLAAYLERDKRVDQLRDMLLACSRAAGAPPRAFDPAGAVALVQRLQQLFADPEALERSLALKGNDKRYVPPWLAEISRALAGADRDAARALAACDAIKEPGGKLLKRVAESTAHRPLADALNEALAASGLDEALAAHFLPPILDRAHADKAERGQFDYDDMLRLVRDTLRGDRGDELAARLRTRTPWVLIDEFQDTDPVQWDIFREVWLHDDARGLAIVGDPKQAIYGFRGADVATYLAARDQLLARGATQVVLATNRRSSDALVAATNAILLPQLNPLLDREIRYDHPVTASGTITGGEPKPPVAVFALNGPGREDNRAALAQAIAVEVERLRAAAPTVVSRGEERKFALSQVMVLARGNKECLAVAAALRARGLPCELREGERLFATREAYELAAVLAAIAAPRDRSARMRALRTRFFDVPWAELMRVVDAPDHHPAIARLHEWAAMAVRRAYEPLFRRLVEDSHFAERALVLGGGERALVNTWHLIELLLEEVAHARCDLHELVGVLRRWMADDTEQPGERDVQRIETDADAIRVLTFHKAKGLEAPYVFLYGASGSPPRSRLSWRAGSDVAENQRLAYVALTRAQVRLYLPRYGDKGMDSGSMYMQIQRCLLSAMQAEASMFETIDVAVPAVAAPVASEAALAGSDVPTAPPRVEIERLEGARAGLRMLSYTRLARDLEAATALAGEAAREVERAELDGPGDERAEHAEAAEPGLGEGDLPRGIDTGLFLHDVLEHVNLERLRRATDAASWAAEPDTRALFAHHARARGIGEEYLPHAARIVHATMTAPLDVAGADPLPPLVAAAALAREVEFAYPIPAIAGSPSRGLVKGFCDVLVAWNDELWILDYKSDVLPSPAEARAHVDAHYALQARLYALAADRMRGSRRLAGMLFTFLRYGTTVALRVSDDKLAEWSTWLAALEEAPVL